MFWRVARCASLTSERGSGTLGRMAEIELAPLSERLEDDEVKTIERLLGQAGAKWKNNDDHGATTIAARLSEEAMTEFLDRLDAHDVAAEIYIPAEFEVTLSVGEYRVSSTQALADALEEIKEELDVEEEEEEEEYDEDEEEVEDDDEGSVIAAQLRHIWRLLNDACTESLDKNIPLHIHV